MKIKDIEIRFLGHSGFLIDNGNGKKIAIDPYNVSDKVEKVDYILITHSHYDHCSIKDIVKLANEKTVIIIPPDAQSKITKVENVEMQIVEVGNEIDFGNLKIETFPAYNIGKEYHPKSEGWIGYLIKFNDVIVYHTGDTDRIPEMQKLTGYGKHGNEFVALLHVSGVHGTSAEEAVEVAKLIKCNLAIPMHYGAGIAGTKEDAERFVNLCKEEGVRAELLEKV